MDVCHVQLVVLLVLWDPLMVVGFERQKNYKQQEDHGVLKGHKEDEIAGGHQEQENHRVVNESQRDHVEVDGRGRQKELEFQLNHGVVVTHEGENPEEILEEYSVGEEEEAWFWDTSLDRKKNKQTDQA